MDLVFAGTPPFAVPALRALTRQHRVLRVLTRPDRPAGRGRQPRASAVKEAARELGLPVSDPVTREQAQAALAAEPPDLLVVVAFGMLLPEAMLAIPRHGALNIHASLLPRWRGAAPIARAIEAGDPETGVSIMQMEAGLDTGPVLHRVATPITPIDTGASLHDRLAVLGAEAILRALDAIAAGQARPEPQDARGVTYASKLLKAEAEIDWSAAARVIARRVQAFDPYPVATTHWNGKVLRVRQAIALPEPAAGRPGAVLRAGLEGVQVAAGQGSVLLRSLQVEGGRPLDARAFLNGYALGPGALLGTA